MQHPCNECKGTGESISDKDRCTQCKGEKLVQEKKVLEVHFEKGIQNGQKITSPGEVAEAVSLLPCSVCIQIIYRLSFSWLVPCVIVFCILTQLQVTLCFYCNKKSTLSLSKKVVTYLWSTHWAWQRRYVVSSLSWPIWIINSFSSSPNLERLPSLVIFFYW